MPSVERSVRRNSLAAGYGGFVGTLLALMLAAGPAVARAHPPQVSPRALEVVRRVAPSLVLVFRRMDDGTFARHGSGFVVGDGLVVSVSRSEPEGSYWVYTGSSPLLRRATLLSSNDSPVSLLSVPEGKGLQ